MFQDGCLTALMYSSDLRWKQNKLSGLVQPCKGLVQPCEGHPLAWFTVWGWAVQTISNCWFICLLILLLLIIRNVSFEPAQLKSVQQGWEILVQKCFWQWLAKKYRFQKMRWREIFVEVSYFALRLGDDDGGPATEYGWNDSNGIWS